MGWGVYVWGELRFPAAAMTTWRAESVDPTWWNDWPEYLESNAPRGLTVDALLGDYARSAGEGFIDFAFAPTKVTIRGWLDHDVWGPWSREMSAMARVAALLGAQGELCYVGDETATIFGWRTAVGDGTSRVEAMATREVENIFEHPIAHEIHGRLMSTPAMQAAARAFGLTSAPEPTAAADATPRRRRAQTAKAKPAAKPVAKKAKPAVKKAKPAVKQKAKPAVKKAKPAAKKKPARKR